MIPPKLQIAGPHCVDIWSIKLTDNTYDTAALITLLDQREQKRYQRLHPNHQHRYLLSHYACRQILSRYCQIAANEILFNLNQHGKPTVTGSDIQFNLSHSHDLAIVAISASNDIGVDVEYLKPKPHWQKLAKRFFNPDEIDYLNQQAEDRQLMAFFQLWTRKEAFIKALGTGLSTPLHSFNSSGGDQVKLDSDNKSHWYQNDLILASPYIGSVVQNTKIKKIRYYSYA